MIVFFSFIFSVFVSVFFSFSASSKSFFPKDLHIPSQLKQKSLNEIQIDFFKFRKKYKGQPEVLLWLKFKRALLVKDKEEKIFCYEMKKLAENDKFPLKDLALIYAYSACFFAEEPSFSPDEFPKWLRLKYAYSFYLRGKKLGDKKYLMDASYYLGKNQEDKDVKISYLKVASSLARKHKEEKLLQEVDSYLYKLAPRLKPNPEFQDYLAIARDYRRERLFDKAVYFYKKVLNSKEASFEQKNTCFKWIQRIYKIRGYRSKRLKAINQWSRFLSRQKDKKVWKSYYESRLQVAIDYWNLNQNKKSIELLNEILSSSEASLVEPRALWIRALIQNKEGDFDASVKDLDKVLQLLKKTKNKKDFVDKVLWKKAWVLRKHKKWHEALKEFHRLLSVTKNPYLKMRALYWKGETEMDLEKKAASDKTFKQIIREDSFGYYGLLAHRHLNKVPQFNVENNLSDLFEDTRLYKQDLATVYWLEALNEKELLIYFLKLKEHKLNYRKNKKIPDWLAYFSLQLATKNHLKIFSSIGNLESSLKKYFFKNNIHLFFPLEYKQEIEKAITRWKVSKALVFAVIRQESAFNPKARSLSDAFGLMQVIPSTARAISKRIGQPYRGVRTLYDPQKNIYLGSHYLKTLLKKYNNSFILALAAYNAGGTPVKRWLKELDVDNPLEFIEDITYEETRNYIRLLIRNFVFYNRILNEEKEVFPSWLFHLEK